MPVTAPVEMTILFIGETSHSRRNYGRSSPTELSSRPERSVVERSAVSLGHDSRVPGPGFAARYQASQEQVEQEPDGSKEESQQQAGDR
jgi:hypothetical protein